jgi:hypothetical protein
VPKHNANEGERCTYKETPRDRRSKRPLLFSITTAFILLSPTAATSVALASLSYDTERMQPQKSALGLITNQQSVLPKSYRDLLLPRTSLTPSESDINRIESSITQTQKQLDTLSQQLPKDQTQLTALQAAIEVVQARLDQLNANLKTAKENYAQYLKAQSTLSSALDKYNAAVLNEKNLTLALTQATFNYDTALAALNNQIAITASAKEALDTARSAFTQATSELNQERQALSLQELLTTNAKSQLDSASSNNQTLTQLYNNASEAHSEAQAALTQADFSLSQAQAAYNQAQTNLNQAQSNYDNNLIPDPNWTAPTYQKENTRLVPYTEIQLVRTLVPRTTYITTGGIKAEVFDRRGYNNAPPLPTQNEVPIHTETVQEINFNWGSGQVLNSGRSEDVIVRFTGNIMVPQDGYYQFYSPADDGTKLNIAGMDLTEDWYDKGGGGTISDPVFIRAGILYPFTLHYYENGGGANVSLQTYSPQQGFNVLPSTWLGTSVREETTYEEVITYEEVTKYREEIYYTTEPVLIEGTLQVKINEGGQATFTAPEGSTFTRSNLRYEAVDRPECGVDINPPVKGQTQVTISADNSVWGDPCGGWYKHITGTISYLGQPTAPLIKNPALLAPLQEAQVAKDLALLNLQQEQSKQEASQESFSTATQLLTNAQEALNNSDAALEEANQAYLEAQTQLSTNKSKVAEAEQKTNTAQEDLSSKESAHTSNEQTLLTNQQTEQSALATKTSTETQLSTAKSITIATSTEKTAAEAQLTTTETETATAYQTLATIPLPDLTPVQQILDIEPTPEPELEEQGSAEIPAVIENLMDINLEAVDPTELTEAQAEQLVAAALETFETATEGSPEYEQALDALFLAAQQDDIEVDPALADIPGVGQAAAAVVAIFNLVGNVGADISPEKRKEAQTLVVTTLVVGQIAQAAAMASATSASSFRRK